MHLTIVYDDAYIACVRACQRSLLHSVHNTFEYGGHKACIDGAAHDGVDEDEFAAPLEVNLLCIAYGYLILLSVEFIYLFGRDIFHIWLYDDVNLTELSCSARLFLVAIVGTCCLGDGLAVRYAGFAEVYHHLVEVFYSPFESAEVKFALSRQYRLAKLFRPLYDPRRVFGVHTVEYFAELFVFALVLGFDGTTIFRGGVVYFGEYPIDILTIHSITCAYVFELDCGAYIARHHFVDLRTSLSCNGEYLRDTLFAAIAADIDHIVTTFYLARHHLVVKYDMRFDTCLKEE